MSRPLLAFLLRRHWLAASLCLVPPLLIGLMMGLFYPRFLESRPMLSGFMPIIQQLFGGGVLDMMSPKGFLIVSFQHPLVHAAFAVVACIAAMATPAGARGDGSLELLLATGLQRHRLVLTVLAFTLLAGVLVALAPVGGAVVAQQVSAQLRDVPLTDLLPISGNALALIATLAAVAMGFAVTAADRGAALLRYAVFTFGTWILDLFGQLYDHPWLSRLTPFGWYRPAQAAVGDSVWPRALVLGAAALVLGAAAVGRAVRARHA